MAKINEIRRETTLKVLKQLNFSDKITVIIEKDKNGSIDDLTQTATIIFNCGSSNTVM